MRTGISWFFPIACSGYTRNCQVSRVSTLNRLVFCASTNGLHPNAVHPFHVALALGSRVDNVGGNGNGTSQTPGGRPDRIPATSTPGCAVRRKGIKKTAKKASQSRTTASTIAPTPLGMEDDIQEMVDTIKSRNPNNGGGRQAKGGPWTREYNVCRCFPDRRRGKELVPLLTSISNCCVRNVRAPLEHKPERVPLRSWCLSTDSPAYDDRSVIHEASSGLGYAVFSHLTSRPDQTRFPPTSPPPCDAHA